MFFEKSFGCRKIQQGLAVSLCSLCLLGMAACGDSDDGGNKTPADTEFFKGPIAPLCTEELGWCAQTKIDTLIHCVDVDLKPYSITTAMEGVVQPSCSAEDGDLYLAITPPDTSADHDVYAVRFWLKNYAGPGTYPLLMDLNDSSFRTIGLTIQGVSTRQGQDVSWATAGICAPITCEAIVHGPSQPVPHADSVQEFRVRVEVICDPGTAMMGNEGADCSLPENRCTLQHATIKMDVQCSN